MLKAKQIRALSHGMAAALLAGDWSAEPMNARLADALGRRWRWRRTVVRHLLEQHATPPSYEILAGAIASDTAFQKAVSDRTRPHIVHWFLRPSTMLPGFSEWRLPPIDTPDALGRLLELTHSQLRWLADCERRRRRDDASRCHYRASWRPKPSGGWRLVEEPLYLLKCAQRRLLHEVLDRVPPHPAACAFTRTRTIVDYAGP